MAYDSIVISSGHGLKIRGAAGNPSGSPSDPYLDEVDEARKVVNALAEALEERGVDVVVFHDDTSTNQDTNLKTIVSAHNKHDRQLDISCHFNAYEQGSKCMGTEVLYVTQGPLADELSAAIAESFHFVISPSKIFASVSGESCRFFTDERLYETVIGAATVGK